MKQKGMTLTSVLVAVALTSALAAATAKLISNQTKLNKIMTLTDQRDMITRFYSALMHNRVVWLCTLYDTSNSALLDDISGTTTPSNRSVELRTPDCKFKEAANAGGKGIKIEELRELTATHGSGDHYRSSGKFFSTAADNSVLLGQSLTEPETGGWWKVSLTTAGISKGSVDLTLTVEFDLTKYKAAHAEFDPPDFRETTTYKVRKGDPNVENMEEDCTNSAVVSIDDLNSGVRGVTCSSDLGVYLVDVPTVLQEKKGNFLHTLADGTDARVGTAPGTENRVGLEIEYVFPHAIENITSSGDYVETVVNSKPGVLAFSAGNVCSNNSPVLWKIDKDGFFTNHKGPRGVQGLPGPPGYWGPKGEKGDPAPACPSPKPDCSSI